MEKKVLITYEEVSGILDMVEILRKSLYAKPLAIKVLDCLKDYFECLEFTNVKSVPSPAIVSVVPEVKRKRGRPRINPVLTEGN